MTARPVRVLHLITDLDVGGAEGMLSRVVRAMDPAACQHLVVSLTDEGIIGRELAASGIEVRALGLRRGQMTLVPLFTLRRWIREWRPDVVETWMYHADLLGALATLGRSSPALVWNLRASNLDMSQYRRLSGLVRAACARLSRRPALIVANSQAGVGEHRGLGYRARRWAVLPNGIDITEFTPRPDRRTAVRQALGIPRDAIVVGVMARYDPMKGHDVLARAAADWLGATPAAHLLVAGSGVDWEAAEYARLAEEAPGVVQRVHLLGLRRDVADLWNACDIGCSPSHGEGFANAIAEAMACGVPVVATDVGDSARIVGDPSLVVPPGDHAALSARLSALVAESGDVRRRRGEEARRRVTEQFSLEASARQYLSMYRSVARRADDNHQARREPGAGE